MEPAPECTQAYRCRVNASLKTYRSVLVTTGNGRLKFAISAFHSNTSRGPSGTRNEFVNVEVGPYFGQH